MTPRADIKATAAAALSQAEAVLAQWLPQGRRQGSEWVSRNPTRNDDKPGSFSASIATGRWSDFATGDKGGDLVSLVAYLDGTSQGEAARRLADWLDSAPIGPPKRNGAAYKPQAEPLTPIPSEALAKRPRSHPRHGQPTAEWEYRDAEGRPLFSVCRFDPPNARKQFSPLIWTAGRWRWQAPPAPRPLYGLDRLAARPQAPVCITEGEKAADAAAELLPDFVAASPMNGANAPSKADWSPLAGRRVLVWPDHDEPGAEYAAAVAELARQAGAANVDVLDPARLGDELPKGWDAADALAEGWTAETLVERARQQSVEQSSERPETLPEESLEATVERLAKLKPLDYDRARKVEAKRLGVRPATLDTEVKKARSGSTTEEGDPPPLADEVESWPDPVDGAELAGEIRALLCRHMVLPDGADVALSLWALGSYCFDAFRIWPKLSITSPEKRCGKSTLLTSLIAPLVHRALVASNITPAAVFRVIEAWKPTLLIDEADTFLAGNDELRGIVNSGHTKSGAFVVRTVGDDHEPKRFSTWAPMAIAMIGKPPGTIVDRSVTVQLRRRLPEEQVAKIPLDFEDDCGDLRRRAKRWAEDHMTTLRNASPALPPSPNDRALDNWTPLLGIAEVLGGTWPTETRAAFELLTVSDDDDDVGPMILADIRHVFTEANRLRLHSTELVNALAELDGRPWSEWRRGKPLSTASLSRLLKHYRIAAKQLKIGGVNKNGYELRDFEDAFNRYLVALDSPTPQDRSSTTLPLCFTKENEQAKTLPGRVSSGQKTQEKQSGRAVEFQKGVEGNQHTTEPQPTRYREVF